MSFRNFLVQKVGRLISDKMWIRIKFFRSFKRLPDFKNPKTFNEKLQWLKLYDRKPEYTTMVDKFASKKYVADRIGKEYVVPLLGGPWYSFDEIDFETLPDKFVLKTNHDCGGVIVCRDKKVFDKEKAKAFIEKHMKSEYYWSCREWPYKNVKPCIFAEKFMSDESQKTGLTDYKFYCFNGEPQFLYVSMGLEDHATASISFLTLDWEFAPYERSDYKPLNELPKKPKNFEQMIEFCRKLSKDIDFLRVDLFVVDENIYFSELTFSPCGGFMPFKNEEHDLEIGKMLNLSSLKK